MTRNHPIWMEQDREAGVTALNKLAGTREARQSMALTPREKSYLNAVEILFGEGTKEERDFKYAEAMRVVAATYPNDENAQTFYALSLMGTAHKGRDIPTYMRAAAILEEVFHDHPQHPGAAHYLIHAVDDPAHAVLGLKAARAYSSIAPRAGHAQHMTSHIFLALGMWDDVVHANEVAMSVVNAQRKEAGKPLTFCGHYSEWLEYGYLEQGRIRDARTLLDKCADGNGSANPADMHTGESFVSMWSRYLFDTNDWTGPLANWEPSHPPSPDSQLTFEFTRGFGQIRRREIPAARETLARLQKLRRDQDPQRMHEGGTATSKQKRAAIFEQELQSLLLAAGADSAGAISLLKTAAINEASLPAAFGPPFVEKPSSELLGEVLAGVGRADQAISAFRDSLARAPRRTASLLGLARAARAAGDSTLADQTYAELRAIWKLAGSIPEDARARNH